MQPVSLPHPAAADLAVDDCGLITSGPPPVTWADRELVEYCDAPPAAGQALPSVPSLNARR